MSRKNASEAGFNLEKHKTIGGHLKYAQLYLDRVKAELNYHYPASSDKDVKILETSMEKVRLVQGLLHSRLVGEFPKKDDEELLPVYLGRLFQNSPHRIAPETDESSESDTQPQEVDTDPSQPDVEHIPSNGSSDLPVDQELAAENGGEGHE